LIGFVTHERARPGAEDAHLVVEHADGAHVRGAEFALRHFELLLHVAADHPAELVDVENALPRVAESGARTVPIGLESDVLDCGLAEGGRRCVLSRQCLHAVITIRIRRGRNLGRVQPHESRLSVGEPVRR